MRPAEYHFLNPRGVNSDAFNPVGRHCALYDGMFFQRLQLLRPLPCIKFLLAKILSKIGKIPCRTLRYRLRCRFKKQKRLHNSPSLFVRTPASLPRRGLLYSPLERGEGCVHTTFQGLQSISAAPASAGSPCLSM